MDHILQTLRRVLARQWSARCAALSDVAAVSQSPMSDKERAAFVRGLREGHRRGYWSGAVDILTSGVVTLDPPLQTVSLARAGGDEVGPH